jgi:hypothetical protein
MPKPKTTQTAAKSAPGRSVLPPSKGRREGPNKTPRASTPPLRAAPATPPASVDGAPTGKLGIIMTAVSSEAGATLAELSATTGWLPHTTRAALCRLRQRGFAVNLAERDGRRAYRLTTRS